MSFPWHDRLPREAAEFLGARARPGQRILAPDIFWPIVSRIERYVPENLETTCSYDWVVLDTSDMPLIPRAFLTGVAERMTPVFVNGRYAVWSADFAEVPDPNVRERLAEFWAQLAKLDTIPAEPNRYVDDPALGDTPAIVQFGQLSDAELRAAIDDKYRRIGYQYPTRRDQGFREDMLGHVTAFLQRDHGTVLDMCSKGLGFAIVPDGASVIRADLSEVGLALARTADRPQSAIAHAIMDASQTAFPDGAFDAVILFDSIEHVRDAPRVLREAARVVAEGGELLVTFANRQSLHVVLTERLGYPAFRTNHEHIREFTLDEVVSLLEDVGFEVDETAGVSLYPYWGVPGVDEIVRKITDDDPEFVDLLRELGRRVGAEYAFTGVVRAHRVGTPAHE